jgi:DNA replication protein DnaC
MTREQQIQADQSRNKLQQAIGPRYSQCRLGNYQTDQHDGQAVALERAKNYARTMGQQSSEGRGLVFFGRSGTGKDHLLAALANVASTYWGYSVRYENGPGLFARFRQAMTSKADGAELRVVEEFTQPQILWLSDPVPPGTTKLTDHQAGCLFAVIDARYRMQRPTWVSCNVTDSDEANELFTLPVADRLRDGATSMFFDWASFREGSSDV